jgi:hypothetical protein
MLLRTLEAPSAVLSACVLPADAARGLVADGAPHSAALLHRLDRVTACVPCVDGVELRSNWLLPEPTVAVAPLSQGLALVMGQSGRYFVVNLPRPLQQQESQQQAPQCESRALVIAEAAPPRLPGSCTREGGALNGPAALLGCKCSPPVTVRGSGGVGDRTFVLASRAHGVLQLATWWHTASGGNPSSASGSTAGHDGCSGGGQLDVAAFRATPALLTGGLPGRPAALDGGLKPVVCQQTCCACHLLPPHA